MRRFSSLFPKRHSTYQSVNDNDSSSGSDSPRKTKSSEWKTVDVSEVFAHQPPKKTKASRPPKVPRRLKEKNPQASVTRPKVQPEASDLSPCAKLLFEFLGKTPTEAQLLVKSSAPLARATLGKNIAIQKNSGASELTMREEAAFDIFESLVGPDADLACRFLASLQEGTFHNMLCRNPERIRDLLEQIAIATEHESGLELNIVQDKFIAVTHNFIDASKRASTLVGLDVLLNACPSWALPAVLETILAVDSNPDPLNGSPSLIDAWCKDTDFADALRDARKRYTEIVD